MPSWPRRPKKPEIEEDLNDVEEDEAPIQSESTWGAEPSGA